MTYGIIVTSGDADRVSLPGSMAGCEFWVYQKGVTVSQSGRTIEDHVLARDCIGIISFENATSAGLSDVQRYWQGKFGLETPPHVFLDPEATQEDLAAALVELIGKSLSVCSAMNVRLAREIAILRNQHEEMQQSFERLEAFVFSNGLEHRQISSVFSPATDIEPVSLSDQESLVARIPDSSPGLSDLAVWIDRSVLGASGTLFVTLHSHDAGEKLASWEIGADRLMSGWNRFSLERALGPDPVTLHVRIRWAGDGVLALMASHITSDDRFSTHHSMGNLSRTLALSTWKFVAGVAAPVPARAHLGKVMAGRAERITASALKQAISGESLRSGMPTVDGSDAMLLHVPEREDQVASCYLPDMVDSSAVEVIVDVKTRHPQGPVVEYCAIVAPKSQRPTVPGNFPEVDHDLTSGWVRVLPDESAQLRVTIARELKEPHDLWFMVRLAPELRGGQFKSLNNVRSTELPANAFGWSSISGASIRFGIPR